MSRAKQGGGKIDTSRAMVIMGFKTSRQLEVLGYEERRQLLDTTLFNRMQEVQVCMIGMSISYSVYRS